MSIEKRNHSDPFGLDEVKNESDTDLSGSAKANHPSSTGSSWWIGSFGSEILSAMSFLLLIRGVIESPRNERGMAVMLWLSFVAPIVLSMASTALMDDTYLAHSLSKAIAILSATTSFVVVINIDRNGYLGKILIGNANPRRPLVATLFSIFLAAGVAAFLLREYKDTLDLCFGMITIVCSGFLLGSIFRLYYLDKERD